MAGEERDIKVNVGVKWVKEDNGIQEQLDKIRTLSFFSFKIQIYDFLV